MWVLLIWIIPGTIMLIFWLIDKHKEYESKKYDYRGFDKNGVHKNGTRYNDSGYDHKGYNKEGFHYLSNEHRNGTKYNNAGYDYKGIDKRGFNKDKRYVVSSWNTSEYDKDGYDFYGYNKSGYDKSGYDKEGYNSKGFTKNKTHKNGTKYDDHGFDFEGYDKDGYKSDGYNKRGFNREKTHMNGTLYNNEGYDFNGYNTYGFNDKGLYLNGEPLDNEEFDFEGIDKHNYNRAGQTKRGNYWWESPRKNLVSMDYYQKFYSKKTPENIVNRKQVYNLINNSYNILGLQTDTHINSINKTASDYMKFIKANINPKINHVVYKELIDFSEQSINTARDKLNNVQNKIEEMFFWLEYTNDENYNDLFNNIELSLMKLYEEYKKENNIFVFKNIIILKIIYAVSFNRIDILKSTIDDWKKIVESEEYWTNFNANVISSQDFKIEENILKDFRKNILLTLSNFYHELTKDTDLIEVNKYFYGKYKVIDQKILEALFVNEINSGKVLIEKLNTFKKAKSGLIFSEDFDKLYSIIDEYDDYFNDLKKHKLEKMSVFIDLNEKFASSIRNYVVDKFNENNYIGGKLTDVLRKLRKYTYSDSLKNLIQKDIRKLADLEERKDVVSWINFYVGEKKYEEAEEYFEKLRRIDRTLYNQKRREYLAKKLEDQMMTFQFSFGQNKLDIYYDMIKTLEEYKEYASYSEQIDIENMLSNLRR